MNRPFVTDSVFTVSEEPDNNDKCFIPVASSSARKKTIRNAEDSTQALQGKSSKNSNRSKKLDRMQHPPVAPTRKETHVEVPVQSTLISYPSDEFSTTNNEESGQDDGNSTVVAKGKLSQDENSATVKVVVAAKEETSPLARYPPIQWRDETRNDLSPMDDLLVWASQRRPSSLEQEQQQRQPSDDQQQRPTPTPQAEEVETDPQPPPVAASPTRPSLDHLRSRFSQLTTTITPEAVEDTTITTIEVTPGNYLKLRGAEETWEAIQNDFFVPRNCPDCNTLIVVIADATFVVCPVCKSLSPVVVGCTDESNGGDGGIGLGTDDIKEGGGVGLGFRASGLWMAKSK